MRHRELHRAVDEQRAGKEQIGDLPDLAGIAVFERQHRRIAVAVLRRVIGALKIGERALRGVGEQTVGGDIGKCADRAAVGNAHPLGEPLLIPTGHRHCVLEKIDIIRPQRVVLDPLAAGGDDLSLACGVQDRQPVRLFIGGDLGCCLHPFDKQRRHLGVHAVYGLSCLL